MGRQKRRSSRDSMPAELVVVDLDPARCPGRLASTRACGLICWATNTPRTGRSIGSRLRKLEVAGELLDAVDLAAPLDLDRDRACRRRPGRAGRPARCRSGTRGARGAARPRCTRSWRRAAPGGGPRRRPSAARGRRRAPTRSPRAPRRCVIVRLSPLGFVTVHAPSSSTRRFGGVHPVERLVGAAVGVDRDAAVGLHHEQPGGHRQVRARADPRSRRSSGRSTSRIGRASFRRRRPALLGASAAARG